MRKAFVSSGCLHCRKIIMPIEEINAKIPVGKRIDTIDSYAWEHFQMMTNPIFNKLKFEGYPTIFIDGIKIKSVMGKNQVRAFLNGFLKSEMIVPETKSWERIKNEH